MAQFFQPVVLNATADAVLLRAAQLPASDGTRLVFVGASWSGSVVLKVDMGAPGQAQSLTSVAYLTASTGATNTAGTAITASGDFIVTSEFDNYDLYATYTHTSGSAVVYILSEDATFSGAGPGGDIFADEVNGSGGRSTFGAAIPYTGIYSFPSQVGIGTAGSARFGVNLASSATASSGSAIGFFGHPTLIATANNDVLYGHRVSPAYTPSTFTGVIGCSMIVVAYSTATWTSPGDQYQIDIQAITATGATNAYGIRIAPPTGASNNYLIAHTTAATFNVLASGAITTASTINAGGLVTVTMPTGGAALSLVSSNATGVFQRFIVNGTARGYIGSADQIIGGSASDFVIQAGSAAGALILATSAGNALQFNASTLNAIFGGTLTIAGLLTASSGLTVASGQTLQLGSTAVAAIAVASTHKIAIKDATGTSYNVLATTV